MHVSHEMCQQGEFSTGSLDTVRQRIEHKKHVRNEGIVAQPQMESVFGHEGSGGEVVVDGYRDPATCLPRPPPARAQRADIWV